MADATYAAVFLRRLPNNNTDLFAIDPGDGTSVYVEVPIARERIEVGLSARSKWHNRNEEPRYRFGEKVNLRVERVES